MANSSQDLEHMCLQQPVEERRCVAHRLASRVTHVLSVCQLQLQDEKKKEEKKEKCLGAVKLAFNRLVESIAIRELHPVYYIC